MPENVQDQKPNDFLESLLTGAAERAAKIEADEALRKGYVTREQINMALDQFGATLEATLADKILGAVETQIQNSVAKALSSDEMLQKAGLRRSTVLTPEQERENDPVAYLLQKGRSNKGAGFDQFDQVDKDLAWELTKMGLQQGMLIDLREE